MIITLKRPGTCAECGASLPKGARAKWYRNGAVYCHSGHSGKPAKTEINSGVEDYICSDLAYEDRCAEAVNR